MGLYVEVQHLTKANYEFAILNCQTMYYICQAKYHQVSKHLKLSNVGHFFNFHPINNYKKFFKAEKTLSSDWTFRVGLLRSDFVALCLWIEWLIWEEEVIGHGKREAQSKGKYWKEGTHFNKNFFIQIFIFVINLSSFCCS